MALGIAGTALLLTACSTTIIKQTEPITINNIETGTISVEADSKQLVTPDEAVISLGLESRGKTAKEANDKQREKNSNVISKLKELGVTESTIKTSNLELEPVYYYNDRTGKQSTDGYKASTDITISKLKVDDVGKIADQCIEAGADRVDGISYRVSSEPEVYKDLIAEATDIAKNKAEVIAEKAGCKVNGIKNIREIKGYNSPLMQYNSVNYKALDSVNIDSPETEIMPGEQEITAKIEAEFYVK